MATQIAWRIRGDLLEACSCTTTCPCNLGTDPTQLPCEAVLGWGIQEGNYGDSRLDSLNVVVYLSIPGNAFAGGGTLGAYLDQRADQQQVDRAAEAPWDNNLAPKEVGIMAVEPRRLDFNEFATNLSNVFDSLKREGRPVIVDREGDLYRLEPETPEPQKLWKHYNADRVRQALRASAGAVQGVNRDELLADIHAQRAQRSHGRPGD